MLINAGIKRIVYEDGYPDELGMDMLQQADIEVQEHTNTIEDTKE